MSRTVPLSAAFAAVLLAVAPVRAAESSVSYKDIREAAVSVIGDFARFTGE